MTLKITKEAQMLKEAERRSSILLLALSTYLH
jgi:hypothetical protein